MALLVNVEDSFLGDSFRDSLRCFDASILADWQEIRLERDSFLVVFLEHRFPVRIRSVSSPDSLRFSSEQL